MVASRRRVLRSVLRGLALTGLMAVAGCAMTGPRPAVLRVRCNVPEATLWIDDAFAGRVGEWSGGQALGPGFRRVEIRQAGFFTFSAEISPEEGQAVSLDAELRPHLD
jgi:hypothetical protein